VLILPQGVTDDHITVASGGKLQMYLGGTSFSISGNNVWNQDGLAGSFIVYCAPTITSIALSGNGSFTGVIVAPNADFQFNGGGRDTIDFIGALVVKSVKLNGHFNMHYDECLAEIPPAGRYLITHWDEVTPTSAAVP